MRHKRTLKKIVGLMWLGYKRHANHCISVPIPRNLCNNVVNEHLHHPWVNNKFVDELLALLNNHLLPTHNCLLTNMYHAKTLTRKMGPNYKIIHTCPNGCVLFRDGRYAKLNACPKCGLTRYKDVG
jgi:hypothetical protein